MYSDALYYHELKKYIPISPSDSRDLLKGFFLFSIDSQHTKGMKRVYKFPCRLCTFFSKFTTCSKFMVTYL